ncbi:MAG: ethanolamine ammonia-lyase subunit EutC [Gammaproteobacteria bacterium]
MNDCWYNLRRFTQARIAQGHAGCGLPTAALLDFQLAHALARDAIHQPWDIQRFAEAVTELGLEPICLATPVADRAQYLQRPDLGRRLDEAGRQKLCVESLRQTVDVALILSNGLSAIAVQRHGLALLQAIAAAYRRLSLRCGPVFLVPNARVALADEIGGLLNARLSVIVVGERPGLSAADSLGVYLTYAPEAGKTDADRNCISNIRPPEGLSYEAAAAKLAYLSYEALQRRVSGVALKDDMPNQFLG